MRTSLPVALLLVSTLAFAGPPLALADAIRLEEEISAHLVEINTAVANIVAGSNQLALQYVALDAKATTLRLLASRCATSCSAEDRAALGAAASDLAQTQAACGENVLQIQIAMQRENQWFTSISNVLKTKHDTVKNSIGNIK